MVVNINPSTADFDETQQGKPFYSVTQVTHSLNHPTRKLGRGSVDPISLIMHVISSGTL